MLEQFKKNECFEQSIGSDTRSHEELYSFALFCMRKNQYHAAFYVLVTLGEYGYSAAFFLLGYMFETGKLVEHDDDALKSYLIAKQQKHVPPNSQEGKSLYDGTVQL